MKRLLAPRSVAVVGATERPAAYGSEAILNLHRIGFSGAVFAVNPGRETVHGVPCFASLDAVPEAVDAVVVAVPAEGVTAVIEEAGRIGCGGAVVFAAGFAETQGGRALQDDLAAAARQWSLPVCGPNGNGIVSVAGRVALWGDMVSAQPAGSVALVTQSGNVAVNALASRRGLRLHTVVSCGNAAVVSPEEYVAAIAELDGVRSIALYLEDDGDGAAWCDALALCAERGVGVAVLKAGSSPAGAAAAVAHTGAVAGDQRAVRAFFEDCGAAWAEDPHELLEFAKALAANQGARPPDFPPGRSPSGVAVMTCSGGDSSVAADLADGLGIDLPALAPATVDRLAALLPDAATVQNPLDYTSLMWDDTDGLAQVVSALGDDPAIGRVLVLYDEPAGLEGAAKESWDAVLGAVRTGAASSSAPVMVASTLPELLADDSAAALVADGLPAIAGLRAGLRTAAILAAPPPDAVRIGEIRALCAVEAVRATPAALSLVEKVTAPRWIAEHDAKALLRNAGIAVPQGHVASDAPGAVAIASALGGAVCVKATGPAIQHKAQSDALRLNLESPRAVRDAATELLAITGQVLVERMADPGPELLVAVRTDTIVPVLVIGLGGAMTEVFKEAAVLPLPVTAEQVEAAVATLRGAPNGAGELAVKATQVALDNGLQLLELNPVIVGAQGAVAVDAVAATAAPAPAPNPEGVLA